MFKTRITKHIKDTTEDEYTKIITQQIDKFTEQKARNWELIRYIYESPPSKKKYIRVDAVKKYIKIGASPNSINPFTGDSVLYIALKRYTGNTIDYLIIQELLKAGADPNYVNCKPIIKFHKNSNGFISKTNNKFMDMICYFPSTACPGSFLFESEPDKYKNRYISDETFTGKDINIDASTPFSFTLVNCNIRCFELLLKYGGCIDSIYLPNTVYFPAHEFDPCNRYRDQRDSILYDPYIGEDRLWYDPYEPIINISTKYITNINIEKLDFYEEYFFQTVANYFTRYWRSQNIHFYYIDFMSEVNLSIREHVSNYNYYSIAKLLNSEEIHFTIRFNESDGYGETLFDQISRQLDTRSFEIMDLHLDSIYGTKYEKGLITYEDYRKKVLVTDEFKKSYNLPYDDNFYTYLNTISFYIHFIDEEDT